MLWQTRTRLFDFAERGAIMGILNVTPDSFSDGGEFADAKRAVAQAREMIAAGAEIIDIGGESTRPGSDPVTADEELRRVLPVIEGLRDCGAAISIDTSKAAVARAAVEAGAGIINDVTGLRGDPMMMDVARETGAGVIVMHMQGTPRDMQREPRYDDIVAEVREFFRQQFDRAVSCGLPPMSIAFDPGIGFGKTITHNLALLKNLEQLRVAARPIVLGVSRKSFIGKVLGSTEMADRFAPTVALTGYLREHGANVLRVHDVRPNAQALRITEAILGASQ